MPRRGTPAVNTSSWARGASLASTDSGPPERMMPRGLNARSAATSMSQGWISQYTPSSRTRRAMSWVYCEPKSRIRMRSAWMSAAAAASWVARAGSGDTVVRRFLGDGHIVHMALAHAGAGDPHEVRAGLHVVDRIAAGIPHRGTQSAGELIQDRHQAALVRHAAFNAFRHQFLQ